MSPPTNRKASERDQGAKKWKNPLKVMNREHWARDSGSCCSTFHLLLIGTIIFMTQSMDRSTGISLTSTGTFSSTPLPPPHFAHVWKQKLVMAQRIHWPTFTSEIEKATKCPITATKCPITCSKHDSPSTLMNSTLKIFRNWPRCHIRWVGGTSWPEDGCGLYGVIPVKRPVKEPLFTTWGSSEVHQVAK